MAPCMNCFVLISALVSILFFQKIHLGEVRSSKKKISKLNWNHNKELKTNKIKSEKAILKAMNRQLLN